MEQSPRWGKIVVITGASSGLGEATAQKSGHIINVSSVAGHKVAPGFAVYAATKHAVRALSDRFVIRIPVGMDLAATAPSKIPGCVFGWQQ